MIIRPCYRRRVQKRPLGATGVDLPVVGMGTWDIHKEPRERVIEALRVGLDLGMTHIDAAEMYGGGRVEEIVGEAIADRRDEVFLATKIVPMHASRQGTLAACEASLKRLQTDVIDLYLLHWYDGSHPLGETFAAFETLREQGKIRAWGVSNFSTDELTQAERVAGPDTIACNQVLYHLRDRSAEQRLLPWCREHEVALVAHSPFGKIGGFPAPDSSGGRVLDRIAGQLNASARQVALAFLQRDPHTFTIPKSGNPDHIRDNAAAGELELSEEHVAEIDATFPLSDR